MVPGVDVGSSDVGRIGTPIGAIAGLGAVLAVSFVGLLATQPSPREARPGETEMAQRSAAVVAGTYRAEVDIDRRDRMLLVSYAGAAARAVSTGPISGIAAGAPPPCRLALSRPIQ